MFTVRDDGPGLREEEAGDPLLFRRNGLGLGLRAARRAAQLHDGALVLENRETGGVRAVLSLPIKKGEGGLLKSPAMGYDLAGGFSPVLVELSGVLPSRTFLPQSLEN